MSSHARLDVHVYSCTAIAARIGASSTTSGPNRTCVMHVRWATWLVCVTIAERSVPGAHRDLHRCIARATGCSSCPCLRIGRTAFRWTAPLLRIAPGVLGGTSDAHRGRPRAQRPRCRARLSAPRTAAAAWSTVCARRVALQRHARAPAHVTIMADGHDRNATARTPLRHRADGPESGLPGADRTSPCAARGAQRPCLRGSLPLVERTRGSTSTRYRAPHCRDLLAVCAAVADAPVPSPCATSPARKHRSASGAGRAPARDRGTAGCLPTYPVIGTCPAHHTGTREYTEPLFPAVQTVAYPLMHVGRLSRAGVLTREGATLRGACAERHSVARASTAYGARHRRRQKYWTFARVSDGTPLYRTATDISRESWARPQREWLVLAHSATPHLQASQPT